MWQPSIKTRTHLLIFFMYTKTYLLLLWIVVFVTSCQQEVSDILPDENPSDTTAPAPGNAIRKIQVKGIYGSDPIDATFTIQYDTPASKITVLVTDAFPGDSSIIDPAYKGIVYQFNTAGYLAKADLLQTNGTLQPAFLITRNAANQLEKLIGHDAEVINGVSKNDTFYYRFAPGLIEDSSWYAGNDFFRTVRMFNAQNQLQSVEHYFANTLYYNQQFRYDAQGSVIQIISDTDTTDYTYGTSAGAAWNGLPQLFLGKDAHVLMREAYGQIGLNVFSFLIEENWLTLYNPLFTQPLTRLVRHGYMPLDPDKTPIRSEVTFTTTYTIDGKVETITATPESNQPLTFTFSY
jgi:hypothetical protein